MERVADSPLHLYYPATPALAIFLYDDVEKSWCHAFEGEDMGISCCHHELAMAVEDWYCKVSFEVQADVDLARGGVGVQVEREIKLLVGGVQIGR